MIMTSIYDHDIYRDVEVLEVPGQVYELEIRVLPVAAPPVAECVFRRERYLSGDFREVPEGGLVVMPVAEEIEVLPVCAVPALHPVLPVAVHRDEHVPAALVYHGPAVLRDYARVVRVDDGLSVAPVQGPGSTEEIPGGVCPGIPFHPLLSVPSRPERDGKVVSGEFSVPAVFQCEVFCLYCDGADMALIELVDFNEAALASSPKKETKKSGTRRSRSKKAAAPAAETPEAEAPAVAAPAEEAAPEAPAAEASAEENKAE